MVARGFMEVMICLLNFAGSRAGLNVWRLCYFVGLGRSFVRRTPSSDRHPKNLILQDLT